MIAIDTTPRPDCTVLKRNLFSAFVAIFSPVMTASICTFSHRHISSARLCVKVADVRIEHSGQYAPYCRKTCTISLHPTYMNDLVGVKACKSMFASADKYIRLDGVKNEAQELSQTRIQSSSIGIFSSWNACNVTGAHVPENNAQVSLCLRRRDSSRIFTTHGGPMRPSSDARKG